MTEDIRQRNENRNRLVEQLERDDGALDVGALYEGARRAEAEHAEHERKLREQQAAAQVARDKELNDLLTKVGEHMHKETETKAAMEIEKAKAEAEKELEAKIRKLNGLKTAEEEATDQSYASVLNSLNLNKNKINK